ncbi:uncharacterized protein LOC134262845 [Saccostrea cucullata]|uniref:uncharacterized protein LOC134262845 n=1 Tax=Saccostrea cuccullata TaxID=36930 RepID=UPI002ED6B21F
MCLKNSADTNLAETNVKSNISRKEQNALKDLSEDSSIIIKEADKGGAIVIMDRDHYKEMVMSQLQDDQFYKKLDQNGDRQTMRRIERLTKKFAGEFTKNEIDYLTHFEVKTSNFYGLPKIHKSKEIQENIKRCENTYIKIPKPSDLKLRPIIAGPSSCTQRLSNLLDLILKPLCKIVPSFIRDDLDFLNYIPEEVQQNTILVSFDVTSLYTNILHYLGLEAVKFWMEKYPTETNERFSKEFILEALQVVLENNHFHFDEQFYLQIKGTAMGTKVAPTYATLVMGYLEEKLYSKLPEIFDETFVQYIRQNWKRYLDDIFIFWNKTEDDLEKFHTVINQLQESIQFTMEMSDRQLPFLDLLLIKDDTKIITDLYCKETDSHQYLDFYSCHPSHTKRNIPYNMARRICTIVTDTTLRLKRLEEFKSYLQKQHYPENLINAGIEKAENIPTSVLRNTRRKDDSEKSDIPFVVTHNPRNHNILRSARRFFPILEQSQNLKDIIKESQIINSRRQAPNLKKILTRARFATLNAKVVKKCCDPRCGTCEYLEEGSEKTLKCGKKLTPNANMTCKSENVIYCITCPTCDENYIGQTGKLNARVRVHKQQIRDPSVRNTPCSEHFATCGKGKFKLFPFYKMHNDCEISRVAKEDYFIKLFNPKLNRK